MENKEYEILEIKSYKDFVKEEKNNTIKSSVCASIYGCTTLATLIFSLDLLKSNGFDQLLTFPTSISLLSGLATILYSYDAYKSNKCVNYGLNEIEKLELKK